MERKKNRSQDVFRILICLCLPVSCQSWGSFWEAGEFTEFRFDAVKNEIHKSYSAQISGLDVAIEIPYGMLRSGVATFTTRSAVSVTVNGIEQVSGVTRNDFSSPVVYLVGNEPTQGRRFTVTVTPVVPLPDTGQTSCYTGVGAGDTATGCTGNSGAYPAQDADSTAPNTRSFSGPQAHPVFTADFTTRDRLSGLTFKTCTEGFTGITCTGTASTQQWAAAPVACAALNSANAGNGYAGRADWRVPTMHELANLINFQASSPTSDAAYFPTTVNGGYWTANEFLGSTAYGWGVSFNNGTVYSTAQKTLANAVRCVSGNAPPAAALTENGDGTVSDRRTGLIWQKCQTGLSGAQCANGSVSSLTWAQALNSCAQQTLVGRSWRLPSANELRSIVDYYRSTAPAIDTAFFPMSGGSAYWSSTTPSFNMTNAWSVDFAGANFGSLSYLVKTTAMSVRCVSGP